MPDQKPNNPMPKIVPDKDDLRGFHRQRTDKAPENVAVSENAKTTSSLWLFLAILLAVASCGASYWLFTQYQAQSVQLVEATQRISDLEQRLSATGQEMDQSAVALQVKVTELSKKADELWGPDGQAMGISLASKSIRAQSPGSKSRPK